MVDSGEKTKPSSVYDSMDFDRAIYLTGYGKFHYEILIACAICIISVGFQNGLSAYIFPAAQCELHLTSFQLGLLNVSFLIGGVVSSFLWGILADCKGRKHILIFSHLTNATLTVICAINQSVASLIFCRFVNGFLIGAPGSIIFSYLAEFQPPKYRSSIICYSGIFFTSSWLLLPVLAWAILPLDISVKWGPFCVITSWRLLLIILALPEVVAGLWFIKLPESPKFFIAKGNPRKALVVLRKMFSINTGKHPKEFPIKNLLSDVRIDTQISDNLQCRGKTVKALHDIYGQFRRLFRSPLLFSTVLVSVIMFTNMFGAFGLGWWLPELFVRFEKFQALHPNLTATVKQLALLNEIETESCKPSFDAAVIQSTVAMGATSLIANGLSGWFATRIPLKTILIATMFLGGLSSMSIYWLRASWQNLVVASIFQSTMVTANMTIGSVVVDLFPTSVSAMAICLAMCAGRIGAMASNIIFGMYMDKQCEIPIFVVAACVMVGAGLCFLIPKESPTYKNLRVKCFGSGQMDVINFDTKL